MKFKRVRKVLALAMCLVAIFSLIQIPASAAKVPLDIHTATVTQNRALAAYGMYHFKYKIEEEFNAKAFYDDSPTVADWITETVQTTSEIRGFRIHNYGNTTGHVAYSLEPTKSTGVNDLQFVDQGNVENWYKGYDEITRRNIELVLAVGFGEYNSETSIRSFYMFSGDYWMATQVLIWEIAQGYLYDDFSGRKAEHVTSRGFLDIIKGTAAEEAYYWIVKECYDLLKTPIPVYGYTEKVDNPSVIHVPELSPNQPYNPYYTVTLSEPDLTLRHEVRSLAARIDGTNVNITVSNNGSGSYELKFFENAISPYKDEDIIWLECSRRDFIPDDPVRVWGSSRNETMYITGQEYNTSKHFYIPITFKPDGNLNINVEHDADDTYEWGYTITGPNNTTITGTTENQAASHTLPRGDYTVTFDAPDQYHVAIESQTRTVTNGNNAVINIPNRRKMTTIQVDHSYEGINAATKQGYGNAVTNETPTWALFENGVFKQNIGLSLTGENQYSGTLTIPTKAGLTVRNTSVPQGFISVSGDQAVGADPAAQNTVSSTKALQFSSTPTWGNIEINRLIEDVADQGAEFQIFLKSAGSYAAAKSDEKAVITSNAQGKAVTSSPLPYGTYTVVQISGSNAAALVDSFDVVISEHQKTYTYNFNTRMNYYGVEVITKDSTTGNVITDTSGYKVKDTGSNQYITVDSTDIFYLNSQGKLMTELPIGTYQLEPVSAPSGYILGVQAPIPFVIDGQSPTITVTVTYQAQTGKLSVTTSAEQCTSIQVQGELKRPVFSMAGISTSVQIKAKQNIYSGGVLVASAGEIVGTVTTDGSGIGQSLSLHIGQYDAVALGQTKTFSVAYAGQSVNDQLVSLSFDKSGQNAVIHTAKLLESDSLFKITGNYDSVSFGIFAAEQFTAKDGSVLNIGDQVTTIYSDNQGIAQSNINLPDTLYHVKELSSDYRYRVNTQAYPVRVTRSGSGDLIFTPNGGLPIENFLKRGTISGSVEDQDGKPVEGAEGGLYHPDDLDNPILTVPTDENGDYKFEDVPIGDWVIIVDTPNGYEDSDTKIPVSIDEDGDNKTVPPIEVEKTDNSGGGKDDNDDNKGNGDDDKKGDNDNSGKDDGNIGNGDNGNETDTGNDNGNSGEMNEPNPQTGDFDSYPVLLSLLLVISFALCSITIIRRKDRS